MFGVWFYYPAAVLLLVVNLVAWTGIFYRLPGNWIILSNCLLFVSLSNHTNALTNLGWFSLCLIGLLAILGDSFNYAVKRHRIFDGSSSTPGRNRVLVGAGLGSLTCVVAGMTVPVIGPLLAILGAVGGAAGGAWFGSVITPRTASTKTTHEFRRSFLSRFLREDQIQILPRLITGILMILISFASSLL